MVLNGIMQLYSHFLQHPEICIDSRVCTPGSIFFALKGENFNANAFALPALEKGCALAVVDEEKYAIDERFILVDNVLESMQQLATYHRQQLGTTIIGITGTNGKTTTKELIAAVLSEKYNILFTQGNLNNHIGVPLTLLRLRPEHELAVIEMGANHLGEIKTLCEIAYPDYGIITNVGKAHLEGFGSFEGIKKTKAELYQHIRNHGKKIFINKDNDHLLKMAAKAGFSDNLSFSEFSMDSQHADDATVYGRITGCSPFLQMECTQAGKFSFTADTQLIGDYNAENVMAAVTIGTFFDMEASLIKAGLEKYAPQNNRSQLTVTQHNKVVVDAYNANPTSMQAAILNFAQMDVPAKTLILGDMLEMGEQSGTEHQNIVNLLQQCKFENVFLIGNEFCRTQNNYACFENVNGLNNHLEANPLRNQYILLKGSRGIKLETTLASL